MPGENALSTQDSTPMSLSAFHSEANYYWNILQEKESDLLKAFYVVNSGKPIWPDQYRRINTLLNVTGEVVRAFCKLLANTILLPPPVVPNRYLLLATLQHMDEQIQTLLPLIITFRGLRKTSSEQSVKLRLEIERKLELLVQGCHVALRHFQALSDQIHFEERKQARFIALQRVPELSREPKPDKFERRGYRLLFHFVT